MIGGLMPIGKKARRTKLVQVREPSGRPSRSDEQKDAAPIQVKRLRDAALAGMADPEWGTELGRLFLAGKVTAPMYAAGKKWAEKASRYQSAINCPPTSPRSCSAERSGFSEPPDPDSRRGMEQAETDAGAVKGFLEAHGVLLGAGLLPERSVRAVCERGEMLPGVIESLALYRGLRWLADYWRLTDAPMRARRGR